MNYTKENPPVVTRNDTKLPLSLTVFGKTSDLKGQPFWTLEATASNEDAVRKFIGAEIVNSVLTRYLRKVALDLFSNKTDNYDAEGHIIWDNILSGFQSLDTGGANKAELAAERDELIDLSNALMDDPDFAQGSISFISDVLYDEDMPEFLLMASLNSSAQIYPYIKNESSRQDLKSRIQKLKEHPVEWVRSKASNVLETMKVLESVNTVSEKEVVERMKNNPNLIVYNKGIMSIRTAQDGKIEIKPDLGSVPLALKVAIAQMGGGIVVCSAMTKEEITIGKSARLVNEGNNV